VDTAVSKPRTADKVKNIYVKVVANRICFILNNEFTDYYSKYNMSSHNNYYKYNSK